MDVAISVPFIHQETDMQIAGYVICKTKKGPSFLTAPKTCWGGQLFFVKQVLQNYISFSALKLHRCILMSNFSDLALHRFIQ